MSFSPQVFTPRRLAQRSFLLLLSLPLILFASPALAWNAAGHRLAAVLAWEHLSPAAKSETTRLLYVHPALAQWLHALKIDPGADRASPNDDTAVLIFAEASTWADEIKRGADFRGPRLLADNALGKDWHYLDWPLGQTRAAALDGQLDRQINRLGAQLADPAGSDEDRAAALVWLLHLIADAQQPLHAAAQQNDGRSDAGGNGFVVLDPDNPRLPVSNLHRFWDDLPGPPWLRGPRLLAVAGALAATASAPPEKSCQLEGWLAESHQLAGSVVYPTGEAPFIITAAYLSMARNVANERLLAAGRRIGFCFNRWLAR